MEITGTHVVITGAARGMGRLFARRCIDRGARVAAWDIDEEGLQTLAQEIRSVKRRPVRARAGDEIREHAEDAEPLFTVACDLSSADDIRRAAEGTLERFGHVDILINNAGIVSGDWITDMDDGALELTFAVNALAPIRVTKSFLPGMLERDRGHVVTIASAAAFLGTPRLADYSASKAAVFSFDEALRNELRLLNSAVRTTVVCPFYADTGMFQGVKTRFSWLLPILNPEKVVDRTLKALSRDRARVIIPWFVYTVFPIRLFSPSVFDRVASFFGIMHSMSDFEGRSVR